MIIKEVRLVKKNTDSFLKDEKGVCFLDAESSTFALYIFYTHKYNKKSMMHFLRVMFPRRGFLYIGRPEKGMRVVLRFNTNPFKESGFYTKLTRNFKKWKDLQKQDEKN